MNIYSAVLCALYAPHSKWAWHMSHIRLAALFGICGIVGILMAAHVPPTPPGMIDDIYLVAATGCLVQTVIVLAHWSAAGILQAQTSCLGRLLLCLPLTRSTRWLLLLLPSLTLTIAACLLTLPSLIVIVHQFGLTYSAIGIGIAIGIFGGLGLVHGVSSQLNTIRMLVAFIVIVGEYTLLRIAIHEASAITLSLLYALMCAVVLLCWGSYQHLVRQAIYIPVGRYYWLQSGTHFWVLKKMLRSTSIRLSLVVAFGLHVLVAYISAKNKVPPEYSVLGVAMVTAAFVSDSRSIARRYTPPEIAGLRGTWWFLCQYLWAVTCCTLLCTLPIWTLGMDLTATIAYIVLAASVGILSALWIAPQARDVTAQCIATTLCLLILMVIPQIVNIQATPLASVLIAGICISTACFVEYRRNPFIWRHHV